MSANALIMSTWTQYFVTRDPTEEMKMNDFRTISNAMLGPYCFYVLIFQSELSIFGPDLVSLLVHHFF